MSQTRSLKEERVKNRSNNKSKPQARKPVVRTFLPKQNAYAVTMKNSVPSEVTTTSGGEREKQGNVSSKTVPSGPEEEGTYNRFSCFAVHSKMAQSTNAKGKPTEGLYTDTDPDNRSEIITDVTIRMPGKAGTMMMEVKVDPGAQPSCIPLHKFKTLFPHLCRDGLPREGLLDNTHNEFQSYNGGDMTCYGHLLIDVKDKVTKKYHPIRFYVMNTDVPRILISHAASYWLGLVRVLCDNKAPKIKRQVASIDKKSNFQVKSGHFRTSTSNSASSSQKKQTTPETVTSGASNIPSPRMHSFEDAKLQARKKATGVRSGKDGDISDEEQHSQDEASATTGKEPKTSKQGNSVHSGPNKKITDSVKDGPFSNKTGNDSNAKHGPKMKHTSKKAPRRKYYRPSDDARVCLDPSNLNKAIIREHHKPMTVEEIAHELAGATVYTKADALKAFLQIHLTHEASLLTTFNSHRGQLRFLRMPFGAKMSQDVFQLRMDAILEQCPGVIGIHDDMVIFGVDQEDHDANLINLLNVCQKEGLVLNSKKLELRRERVTFFGAEYSAQGMHPDPKKVQGITEMTAPTDKQQLQSFLGMVNYMGTFIPNLSHHTEPLRAMLKKDNVFHWEDQQTRSFQLRMDAILEQCPGVIGIHDDMVIFGVDQEDHDANLINLLNVCQKEGLVLNSKKLELRRERVTFFGAEYSAQGMHPDPKKVQGITEMTAPTDKQQLQSFLGMVNYMGTFIPNLSHHTEPLRAMLKKDNVFHWEDQQTRSFQQVKTLIAKANTTPLRY